MYKKFCYFITNFFSMLHHLNPDTTRDPSYRQSVHFDFSFFFWSFENGVPARVSSSTLDHGLKWRLSCVNNKKMDQCTIDFFIRSALGKEKWCSINRSVMEYVCIIQFENYFINIWTIKMKADSLKIMFVPIEMFAIYSSL